MTTLNTRAETLANAAGELEAFSGFNLIHVRRQLEELMRHIGENEIFDQYTRHDITHIDSMLKMLDWLIPSATQECMTSADWLLIVLSIYFHDLGMLVTKAEYNSRNETNFPIFRDSRLTTKDNDGQDYLERISDLSEDDQDRFLYQEFVRANHASRIRQWIESTNKISLGSANILASEIQTLLSNLDAVFRTDLAKVCESHHEADLDDTRKYPVRRPYGNTSNEIANVQYAAIILRTADLMQITRDRTPSIAFRIFTPSDPLSQREWAKHMPVRAVLPQPARDRDGNVDEQQQSSVIEVHARFTEESGFFGLTTYLEYASQQLNQNYEWTEASRKHGSKHIFPWRDIDTSQIETEGFLPSHYEFKIDQRKILDLLTGHTLYNDTNVVVRELTQNAIDAVRLAHSSNGEAMSSDTNGRVAISWDPETRILEFLDNGTGMTQEIIENNFLRVGASRYQDPRFRELHPKFNPISRFGIGVLSAFMISDSVEVFTCHPDDDEIRQISLRSVHGRYLIRLLDKETDPIAGTLVPHGTLVRLRVRASAKIDDVIRIAKSWFVIPQCVLEVSVGENPVVKIGYDDLKQALQDELISNRVVSSESFDNDIVQIRTASRGAVSLAYAVYWSKWFKTWELLPSGMAPFIDKSIGYSTARQSQLGQPQMGICVEGVRVEFDSPGYEGLHLVAIANASGPSAPRTNVARSGLEATPELKNLLQDIYAIYCSHISREIDELHANRGRSATGASMEAAYLLNSLDPSPRASYNREGATVRSLSALHDELRQLEVLLVEHDGTRSKSSLQMLADRGTFYTIDDPFITTAESFLRYLPSDASLRQVLETFAKERSVLPEGALLVSKPTGVLSEIFFSSWQISAVDLSEQSLRITSQWSPKTKESYWFDEDSAESSIPFHRIYPTLGDIDLPGYRGTANKNLYLPMRDIPFHGFDTSKYDGISIDRRIYIAPSGGYLAGVGGIERLQEISREETSLLFHCLTRLVPYLSDEDSQERRYREMTYGERYAEVDLDDFLSSRLRPALQRVNWLNKSHIPLVLDLLPRRPLRLFDPNIIARRARF